MKLYFPDERVVEIESVVGLKSALAFIDRIPDGQVIELKQTEKHTIRAERDENYWIVTARPRGWWFRQTLTTGDWIDPSKRQRKPFWVYRGTLSDAKVQKVFLEFFEGKNLSQPIEGAAD